MKKDIHTDREQFLFTNNNYKILLISLFLLALGFALMIGGGGQTEFDFNPDIFASQRIILAPVIIILGYVGMVFAIFYND
ncbi:MAG: hypothetical protein CMP50_04990 [Flavobacteriales bacterium]|nr:hypothetical protein [Flavobacteriales bacterium]|tara:strand:+ start:619 stop:858 length:240 start_codon:yes stop_codon:yes gene_type:complete